jgi:hypothetical protein
MPGGFEHPNECEGLSPNNELKKEVSNKFLSCAKLMRQHPYNLGRAAEHLEKWVNKELILEPLLDTSFCFLDAPQIPLALASLGAPAGEVMALEHAPHALALCRASGLARKKPREKSEATTDAKAVYALTAQLVKQDGLSWRDALHVAERVHSQVGAAGVFNGVGEDDRPIVVEDEAAEGGDLADDDLGYKDYDLFS